MGPFQVMSTGAGTYYLDLLLSIAAIHPWLQTSFLKLAGPQPARPSTLEDDSYKVEAILQINKYISHATVKWIGYNVLHNQGINIHELRETAPEVVKTFSRGKEQKKLSLRPIKRI